MEMSINEFLADPMATKNDCWGFFDWWCTDRGLKNRMLYLVPKLRFLVKSGLIDGDTHRVEFKNNCPCEGDLYDDMRVINIRTGEMICGLAPWLGYDCKKGKCAFWSFDEYGEIFEHEFENLKSFKEAVKQGQVTLGA